jgi:glutamate synthase (NADPH/NADH) large chain
VEGVGDHGCEYMTGGRVVVLGPVGRNFGAGMSGGIAYLWDEDARSRSRVNRDMVELEDLADATDEAELRALVKEHVRLTGSLRARRILDTWAEQVRHFATVMPLDYKRALAEIAAESSDVDEAVKASGAAAAAVAA